MASFGVNTSKVTKSEGKTPIPDSQLATTEAHKLAEQDEMSRGLPTPGTTPGPDNARLEADKARRQAEASKPPDVIAPDGPSSTDTTNGLVEKRGGPIEPSTNSSDLDGSLDDGQDSQKNAVKRVLKCPPTDYRRILGVNESASKEQCQRAYKKLALVLHPDRNRNEGAGEAFQLINTAAKGLDVPSEEFAENAYGEENDTSNDYNAMHLEQSEAPKPDEFRQKIYEKATKFLGKLMTNCEDVEAKTRLQELNKQISEQNVRDGLPKKDLQNFLVQIDTFIAHFQLAQKYLNALKVDPIDQIAREKLANINNTLAQLNKRHGYPDSWLIDIPKISDPKQATSSMTTMSTNGDKLGQSTTKGGVRTKVCVPIPDESDGRTSLGKVVNVRKAGFGSRVVVNRGTEENPYLEIYPGAEFGKGVAKEWLEEGRFKYEDLPKDTVAKQMTIYGRVKVKKINTTSARSEIQYYFIKVGNKDYISTRSVLSAIKGLSPAKLKRIDGQLDRQNERLLMELNQCREKNEHPDTGEQLTNEDIREMPWLSPETIIDTRNGDDDEDDEDVEGIVPQRMGLKRSGKSKPVSSTLEAPATSEN